MNIKQILKDMGIKLGDFALELEISRPTLNSYIAAYEDGEQLLSEKHQIVFDMFFNNGVESKEEFMDILSNFHRLLERDKVLDTLDYDVEKTDLMTSIIEHMKEDLTEDSYDEDIYTFINMLVRSYKGVSTFRKFARYFLLLNGIKELDELDDEDKPFISNCYKLMAMDKDDILQTDSEYLSKFITRVSEVKLENEKKSEDKADVIKQHLEEMINSKIQEQLKLGLDIEEINIDKILKEFGFEKSETEEE